MLPLRARRQRKHETVGMLGDSAHPQELENATVHSESCRFCHTVTAHCQRAKFLDNAAIHAGRRIRLACRVVLHTHKNWTAATESQMQIFLWSEYVSHVFPPATEIHTACRIWAFWLKTSCGDSVVSPDDPPLLVPSPLLLPSGLGRFRPL